MKKLCSLILIFCFLSIPAFSQEDNSFYRHPKVLEAEMVLTKEATSFIQQRLPNEKVFVDVEIQPLRRAQGDKNEQLPYFYNEDESIDEWDAIDTPMAILLSRIKKATIRVEIPDTISESEIADLKGKLYQQLKLIPERDVINFDKKSFNFSKQENKEYFLYYFITGITFTLLAGLYLISRLNNKTAATTPNTTGQNSQAPSAPVALQRPLNPAKNIVSNETVPRLKGDINFKDSIRAADLLKEKLQTIINAPVFPLLSDMQILEELNGKSSSSFGALVHEMPRKHQQKVFFRAKSDKWFKGYTEAGTLDIECFLAVDKMLRHRVPSGSDKWEELLVQLWRLDEDAYLFFKQIPVEDAFLILEHLPKSFAVPTAKKAFPGRWAKILESKETNPIADEERIEKYLERSLQIKPYYSFKSIDDYKKDLELLEYLRISSTQEEEEIYESLSAESAIHNLRPPFYLIFKAEEEDFKNLVNQYDLSDWALAVLNSPREHVKKINNTLDDKKKYLLSSILKQLDEAPPLPDEQFLLREEMGRTYHELMINKKTKVSMVENVQNNESYEDNIKAA